MNRTKIEWALNPDGTPGYTWNPITGCLNGCEYCYARRLANTRLRERYLANRKNVSWIDPMSCHHRLDDPFYPRFWQEKIYQPMDRRKPAGIFTCDMSDLFGIGVPEEWIRKVLEVAKRRPQHRFYLLTKQPQNLIKLSPFPDNCWVGVSATTNQMASQALFSLKDIKAKVKYLSLEPLLEAVYMSFNPDEIQWVIIGAQTKPTIMPKIEWVDEIEEAARKAGVAIFEKNSLQPLLKRELIQELPQ